MYDFVSEDGIGHKVWLISEQEDISELIKLFQKIPSIYIADGHHRNASAVKVGLKKERINLIIQEKKNLIIIFLYYFLMMSCILWIIIE